MLRITLAQLNLTVGDIEGNVDRMIAAAQEAAAAQSDLVVFSELSLCGYYPGDLLEEPAFLERLDAGLARLCEASAGLPALHWVVGMPVRTPGPGKRLLNALRVLRAGEVRLSYAKQLLPTYNVFDERRHFEPGPDVARCCASAPRRWGSSCARTAGTTAAPTTRPTPSSAWPMPRPTWW